MRPLFMCLKNFRGYGEQAFELSDLSAVLIAGPTGAGKSAIPGAMLWALTGQNGSADPRGHLKLGTDLVQVECQFAHAGAVYRVIRTQSFKSARGKHDCQLAVSDGQRGWIPKTEKSVDETTAAIAHLLGMGYQELTAGPISLQDAAGSFIEPGRIRLEGRELTGRSARLELTKKMLGLAQYEQWRVAAAAEAKELDGQAGILERQVAEAEVALAARPEKAEALRGAEALIRLAGEQQETLSAQIERAMRESATLDAQIPAARAQLAAFGADRAVRQSREQMREEKTQKADHYRDLLRRRPEIEAQAARAQELEQALSELRQDLAALAAEGNATVEQRAQAERQLAAADRAVQAADQKLRDARHRMTRRTDLEAQSVRLQAARAERQVIGDHLGETDESIAGQRERLSEIQQANAETERQRGAILAHEQKVTAEKAGLLPLIAGHERRTRVMETVPCIGVGDLPQRCPLLKDARESVPMLATLRLKEHDLSAWVRPALPALTPSADVETSIRTLETRKRRDQQTAATLDREIATLQLAEAALAGLEAIAATIPELEIEAQAAAEGWKAAGVLLEDLRGRLDAQRARYFELQTAIRQTEEQCAGVAESVSLMPELPLAERELPGLETEIRTLMTEIAEVTARLSKETEVRAWLAGAEGAAVQCARDLDGWRQELRESQEAEKLSREGIALLKAELDRLEDLAAEQAAARAEAAGLRRRHTVLTALAEAYRQIPVMILENVAVPVLEEEANRFLARTSRNRMQVRLETQREIKSREALADGLEIHVRDWRGERSVADFSGGQRFELFLAFRIAWTRLQERRSGAGIGMLWIDEGFGSLSAGDLEGVMAALREMQQGMDFLGVISHVEAMRDLFPARIDVTGGEMDSRAELVRP